LQALAELPALLAVGDLVEKARELGYETLLNDWAKENAGVEGSVRYHLPHLAELGMIRTDTGLDISMLNETDVQDSMETTFGLERDLQPALRDNISQLQDGLKVTDGGKERIVPSGKIDILATAPDHTHVVIELKAGTADRDAVGQVLSYMGDLQGEAEGKVRGILVAGHFTDRAISASRAVPNLELRKYGFKFSFESVR
jgi:hypothetical protein